MQVLARALKDAADASPEAGKRADAAIKLLAAREAVRPRGAR